MTDNEPSTGGTIFITIVLTILTGGLYLVFLAMFMSHNRKTEVIETIPPKIIPKKVSSKKIKVAQDELIITHNYPRYCIYCGQIYYRAQNCCEKCGSELNE